VILGVMTTLMRSTQRTQLRSFHHFMPVTLKFLVIKSGVTQNFPKERDVRIIPDLDFCQIRIRVMIVKTWSRFIYVMPIMNSFLIWETNSNRSVFVYFLSESMGFQHLYFKWSCFRAEFPFNVACTLLLLAALFEPMKRSRLWPRIFVIIIHPT
jgi:hypothetical protein